MRSFERGFTLVEVLVTLVIISFGMLALGSFYAESLSQESVAQERLAAVHMAEQLIEDWQKSNAPPTPDCTFSTGVAASALEVGKEILKCRANQGIPVQFDILISESDALAPLPPAHPKNMNPSAPDNTKMAVLLQNYDPTDPTRMRMDPASPSVKLRAVRVKWDHKGQQRTVYLTNITRYQ